MRVTCALSVVNQRGVFAGHAVHNARPRSQSMPASIGRAKPAPSDKRAKKPQSAHAATAMGPPLPSHGGGHVTHPWDVVDRINGPGKRELAPSMPDYHDANGGLGINKPYQPPGYVSLGHQAGPSLRRRQLARPPATSTPAPLRHTERSWR